MKEAPLTFFGCFVLMVLMVFSSFTPLAALEDQFMISLTVGTDTTVPTTPTNLSANAVSSSQIDLAWTASTDDVGVAAYRVFRDAIFIATSTLLSYSDAGLSPNTLYSYTVSAVDATGNESAQSLPASATTFPQAPPAAGGGGGGGSGQRIAPLIYDVVVTPWTTGATVTWKTRESAQSTLSWGRTESYEMGSSPEFLFAVEHTMTIEGLSPQMSYVFMIKTVSGYGLSDELGGQRFTTLGLAEGHENVRDFTAEAKEESIALTWKNPRADGFDDVRIVRGNGYFPADPEDGEVIYEGGSESFEDRDVEAGVRYYYAIFAAYDDGTYSSGSLASAKILSPGEPSEPFDPFDSLPQAPAVHPQIGALSFLDFDFIQDGIRIATIGDDRVAINGTQNLTVSLDYEKVPELLKTILVSLSHPDDPGHTFSFLLRVNEDKSAYTATIAPLNDSGRYGVGISIVDYKNRGLKKILGSLFASANVGVIPGSDQSLLVFMGKYWLQLFLLLILLILLGKALKNVLDRDRVKEMQSFSNT